MREELEGGLVAEREKGLGEEWEVRCVGMSLNRV